MHDLGLRALLPWLTEHIGINQIIHNLVLRMGSRRRSGVGSRPLTGQAAKCCTKPLLAVGRIRRSKMRSKSSSSPMTSKSSPGCIPRLVLIAFGITSWPRGPMLVVMKYDYHTMREKSMGGRKAQSSISIPPEHLAFLQSDSAGAVAVAQAARLARERLNRGRGQLT